MKATEDKDKRKKEFMDELTGIYNRAGFYHFTRELLDQNPNMQFCLVYWNIRRFKVVNNLFGWERGDKILIHLADSMKEEFGGEIATYGRMERDNFICCLPFDVLSKGKWLRLGEVTYAMGDLDYHFSCCYGLYKIDDRKMSISVMGDRARIAMESVKDNYMCSYAWYNEEMWNSLVEEQSLSNDFKTAIAEKQFKVYYQPICEAVDGLVSGAEALVRWQHPARGLISPGVFIPLFEQNGYISILDRYVWNEVCKMLKGRMDAGKKVLPVSINVSRIEFYNHHLCEDIYNIVTKNGVPIDLIKIEITETAYADNPVQVQEAVNKFHEYGFVVLMDDFGSGYSSLNILKDLPIDTLKIDMKFLNGFETSEKATIILEAVVRMAKWMSLRVVAEGVEGRKEWEFLKSVECDLVQGFYFYKPMPESDYIALLDKTEIEERSFSKDEFEELENSIMNAFHRGDGVDNVLFNSMIGGMGVMEMTEDTLEILQVNRGYYEVLYGVAEDSDRNIRVLNKKIVEPEKSILMEQCKLAREKDCVQQVQLHHLLDEKGNYKWLNVKLRFLGSCGKRSMYSFVIDDIDEMKKLEKERYLFDYSAALLKVFDKVYRLDYETGMAEVLHTSGSGYMQVGDKYAFLSFFHKYEDSIRWVDCSKEVVGIIENKTLLDAELEKSANGSYSISYQCTIGEIEERINVLFFKVEPQANEVTYLCCIKANVL